MPARMFRMFRGEGNLTGPELKSDLTCLPDSKAFFLLSGDVIVLNSLWILLTNSSNSFCLDSVESSSNPAPSLDHPPHVVQSLHECLTSRALKLSYYCPEI